jgi:hypothetical protein
MLERPWIVGGFAYLWGCLSAYMKPKVARLSDPGLIDYLRREQLYRMFHGNRLPPRDEILKKG